MGPTYRHLHLEGVGTLTSGCAIFSSALHFWVHLLITDLDSGKYWSWRVFGINATGHRVEPLDESSCRLVFQVPLWAAPYLVVCKIAVDRIVQLLNKYNDRDVVD